MKSDLKSWNYPGRPRGDVMEVFKILKGCENIDKDYL